VTSCHSKGDTTPPKPTTEPQKEYINETTNLPVQDLKITQFCYDRVRAMYPGYNIEKIRDVWKNWLVQKDEAPRDIDAAFLGFAKMYVERNPLPYSARHG